MTSPLELQFAQQVRDAGLPEPVREMRFHDTRRWRFDFAWPAQMVAVEIEGGVWKRGRHTRGKGFIDDCEKLNQAVLLGWRVFRFPPDALDDNSAIELITEVLT